jgi:hypothetical protein
LAGEVEVSVPGADADPLEALLQADLDEFLKSPAVAQKVIERVSTETRLPALLVRLAYFWLLVPTVRYVQEGIQDHAIEGLVHRITKTFDGFLGNQLTKRLLPKLAEHMAQENANKAANRALLKSYPAVPNISLLSPEALTQAILSWQQKQSEAFRQDVESQLLALRQTVERQPALDLPLAPPLGNEDPFRFVFVARKATFVGRSAELTELREFAGSNEPFRWWSVGGEAGVGKSRLVLEAMLNLEPTRRVGFLPRSVDRGFSWHDWRPLYPTFIVVDDAGIRIPEAASMMQAINMAAQAKRLDWAVRVLLLDRAADVLRLPGWDEATLVAHVRPTQFKDARILRGLGKEDALAIASELAGPENGQAALQLLQGIDSESRPLFVSLAADTLRTGTAEGLGSILDLTRAFLRRTVEIFWAPLGAGETEFDALCLATLVSGLPLSALTDRAWSGLGIPKASPEIRKKLSHMHMLEDSSSEPKIRPLRPSFAGEVFVLDRLHQAVELGESPSEGLLLAAWRHSPLDVAGLVQRALSDLPDHPAMQWIFEAGPELGDDEAREVWSTCLRACIGSRLSAGDANHALRIFEHLLRLVEESPTDNKLSDAAFTAAEIITYLGESEISRAVNLLEDLARTFHKASGVSDPFGAMPPVTKHRQQMLALHKKVAPILDAFLGVGPTWPGALGAAFQAVFTIGAALPSAKARLVLLGILEEYIQPFVDATSATDDPGVFLLHSLLTLVRARRNTDETGLKLNEFRALTHQARSMEALEQGDAETCVAEARAALELAMSVELPDEVPDEIGAWLISTAVDLNQKDYLVEARSLLVVGFGSEEAISSREAIVASLGEAAEPELVNQLYLVATQKPLL